MLACPKPNVFHYRLYQLRPRKEQFYNFSSHLFAAVEQFVHRMFTFFDDLMFSLSGQTASSVPEVVGINVMFMAVALCRFSNLRTGRPFKCTSPGHSPEIINYAIDVRLARLAYESSSALRLTPSSFVFQGSSSTGPFSRTTSHCVATAVAIANLDPRNYISQQLTGIEEVKATANSGTFQRPRALMKTRLRFPRNDMKIRIKMLHNRQFSMPENKGKQPAKNRSLTISDSEVQATDSQPK